MGELLFIEGNITFTRDFTWGAEVVETSIARLLLQNGLAYLQAIRTFTDQWVESVKLDGAGHILLSHRSTAYYGYYCAQSTGAEVTRRCLGAVEKALLSRRLSQRETAIRAICEGGLLSEAGPDLLRLAMNDPEPDLCERLLSAMCEVRAGLANELVPRLVFRFLSKICGRGPVRVAHQACDKA
ncbi:MAG: hypothetical protein V2A79_04410 [Planctomycetota bacterium]